MTPIPHLQSAFALVGEPFLEDWPALIRRRHNMLLAGSPEATTAWLDAAIRLLSGPVHRVACERRLDLPSECATLILDNVDALDRGQQNQCLRWLSEVQRVQTQVISFTTTPLYPQVRAGAFLGPLYYRLNIFYFEISKT
jgi:hypothetical protein